MNETLGSIRSSGIQMLDRETSAMLKLHTMTMNLHIRALACHCECLGMNAENMWAAIANSDPVYTDKHYYEAMNKWGLTNEKGEPTI